MEESKQVRFHAQRGQVLLIVVLVMVVALTVGLSLASRSITNLRTASDQVNADRAFSAAEAGIQRALKSGIALSDEQLDTQTSVKQVTIDNSYGRAAFLINDGNPLPQDDGADIWLSNYPDYSGTRYGDPAAYPSGAKIQIYWGTNAACSEAALEIIVIKGTKANPSMDRYAVDPCNTRGNNFNAATSITQTLLGKTFKYATAISVTNGLIMRIIPLYAGTPIGVFGTDNNGVAQLLPTQGKLITSVGVSGTSQRKISYFAGYDELPSELFYSLFQRP